MKPKKVLGGGLAGSACCLLLLSWFPKEPTLVSLRVQDLG